MIKSSIWLVRLVVVSVALLATPVFAAGGGGGGGGGGDPSGSNIMNPSPVPPATTAPHNVRSGHKGKKVDKRSFLSDPAFIQGYQLAYNTIYDRHDYTSAIDQLKALGHDDYANIANLIGYSYRRLGDYKTSQVWYERALKSDPNHVLTWNYYGFWQIEQGNREQAEYHLRRIAEICGTDCSEYRTLAAALDQPTGTAIVY
ncbi:MAG TPA: hypothetical protein VKR55_16900 [Bradyrhizobium sp.]|uniref:tetratricopeptide repeat protein n=1 Tax=Bradyrhizobium sp. TaxID=376 RepID=UPI002B9119D3|nr:hypothetical protein [Bradyrhizobium sp.]HLZ03813.1 hypothetical protein [Bradyrhizobium sp.]